MAARRGALLFLLHSILDGCDGEIARLKFLESRGGAALDFWGDNTVHVAVFGCMAVGWSLSAHSAWPLVAGSGAPSPARSAAASVVAPHMVSPAATRAPPRSAGARTADALANRDFIYLIVALSAFGKAGVVHRLRRDRHADLRARAALGRPAARRA